MVAVWVGDSLRIVRAAGNGHGSAASGEPERGVERPPGGPGTAPMENVAESDTGRDARARSCLAASAFPIVAFSASAMEHTEAATGPRAGRVASARKSRVRVLVKAVRVHQWVKNGLVLLPIVTSHQIGHPALLVAGLVAFLSFSLCASAVYLLNDILDLEADRGHPTKRHRPLAAGDLGTQAAGALVPVLLVASLVLALLLPWSFVAVLVLYAL